ncbi:MAG: hypothetical protein JNK50_07710 [Bacteroidia bacterium]|nr:hypothetical protein [Bacteroidia bacterium]
MNLISEHAWYFLLLCPLAGLLYAWLLYNREKKRDTFTKPVLYFLTALRFVSVLIITLLLLNLFLKRTINETEKPLILFAHDNSASIIATADSQFIKKDFTNLLEKVKSEVGEKYAVKSLLFGNKVTTGEQPDYNDKETDLSQLLSEIDNNYANQNIGALIITSDGIINRGSGNFDLANRFKFPVYTVALGDTTLTKDLTIKKINHNQVVYLGNKFPVEVITQAFKLNSKASTVSIFKDGAKKAELPLKINSDNFIQTLSFVLEAEKPGVQKYKVVVNSLPEENNKSNNSMDFVVDVIDTREKILLLSSAPHPDIAAIKESLESTQTYEVETSSAFDFNKPLKPYSLVILHNISTNNRSLMNELNTNNQPYLIIQAAINENLPGLKINSSYNKQNETEALLNKNFTLFNLSDELKNFIKDFPAVNTPFGNYITSPGANSLLFQKIGVVETENPLILFNDNSGRKTGIMAFDGLWRWKLRDFAEHKNHNLFNELISKTVQYLAVKADKSFFRLITKKIISENENIEFNAEVYNQSYQLVTEPEVNVIITDSAGKQFTYTMSKTSNAYYLNSGLFPTGEYKYKATVKVNNQVFSQSGSITVKAIVAEKTITVANHQLLHQLATSTGGKLFHKNETEKLKQELLNNETIKPITYSQKQLSDLIDLKWIFFLIIGLLTLEWFLRKRSGTI